MKTCYIFVIYVANLVSVSIFKTIGALFKFSMTPPPTLPTRPRLHKLGLADSSPLTSACVHVVYVCLCSCCVRELVFMLQGWEHAWMVHSRFGYVVHLVIKSIDQSGSSKGNKMFPWLCGSLMIPLVARLQPMWLASGHISMIFPFGSLIFLSQKRNHTFLRFMLCAYLFSCCVPVLVFMLQG